MSEVTGCSADGHLWSMSDDLHSLLDTGHHEHSPQFVVIFF